MKNLRETLTKLNSWKFTILLIFIVSLAFYWWQIRPANIKSSCSHIAVLYAKEGSYSTDLYSIYISLTSSPTYNGFVSFLEQRYQSDHNFVLQSYDTKDYNFNYSRCTHEYGL